MNSDQTNPGATASSTPDTPDVLATPRRPSRRAPARTAPSSEPRQAADAPGASAAPTATAEETHAAAPRRSRARRTITAQDAVPSPAEAAPAIVAPTPPAIQAADQSVTAPAADEPAETTSRTRRRRRGRGARGTTESAEAGDVDDSTYAPILEVPDTAAVADVIAEAEDVEDAETPAGTSRRRRRRGRGGRGAGDSAEASVVADGITVPIMPAEVPFDGATAAPTPVESISPAELRRFDRHDWRAGTDRPAPASARPRPPLAAVAAEPAIAASPEAAASAAPTADAEATRLAPPIERLERTVQPVERRASRFSSQQARDAAQFSTPPRPAPAAEQPAPRTAMVPAAVAAPLAVPGEILDDRIERLIAGQAALLQQQQQALQSMAATMEALQRAIERMTTTGIAAGMPRAGVFVDAPNVVYAAENARVAIDYGRMLDFLCRGREMVHAIVYAPVTEESGFRFEGQRFVAPFLHKGYKLVTKPLKRFPDGTAKGNFDIELAIDIVTMSQRLDVVILISGDSDFSRLIELIQSRGVRVEVVAFASNVSWELVQMADVFIDIGAYLPEFRPA